jgi:hypothetical protein
MEQFGIEIWLELQKQHKHQMTPAGKFLFKSYEYDMGSWSGSTLDMR